MARHSRRHHRKIRFDLLKNARDSFEQAVKVLARKEGPETDESRLKRAIMFSHHSIELLLKKRLSGIHRAFVCKSVDDYRSPPRKTVSLEEAVARLKVVDPDVSFSGGNLTLLRKMRNDIEHYEWNTNKQKAKRTVASALNFAVSFADKHLDGVNLAERLTDDILKSVRDFGVGIKFTVKGRYVSQRVKPKFSKPSRQPFPVTSGDF
jgi:hypothetical protein